MPQRATVTPYFKAEYLRFIAGYGLTSTWATVLLFSSVYSATSSASTVMLSMLPGVVACIGVLLLRSKVPTFEGRSAAASLYATAMALGTLMCTYPALAAVAAVRVAGLILSGFFAILLILTWFECYARLEPRTIVLLSGGALLLSAVVCFAILASPPEAASVLMALLPLVSLSCLPKPAGKKADARRPALAAVLREALSWKTLLGVAISFFVIGAMGILASRLEFAEQLNPLFLLIPAAIAALFAGSAYAAPTRFDASIFYKLLLVGLVAVGFLFVYYDNTNRSLLLFVYILADVLLWTVLALAAKKTPVEAYAVFAVGWLAECVGNVIGQNTAALVGDTPLLFALVIGLVLIAVGFAFGEGMFMLDLEEESESELELARKATSVEPAQAAGTANTPHADDGRDGQDEPTESANREVPQAQPSAQEEAIAAFVEAHELSAREADVFALWVTGHGLKYVQDTLFISESTVKTHLRNIYRKCDTHSRAEIIALFEQESASN